MSWSNNIPELHIIQHYRYTVGNTSFGPQKIESDLGEKRCTINPDSEYQSGSFDQFNEQRTASIYFKTDPSTQTNDKFVHVANLINGVRQDVDGGATYRVESQLNFGMQNRVWRVRATQRESIDG